MKTYNVALKEGVDYNAFWNEIETNGSGSTYVPYRDVSIIEERPNSLRQCWYELSDEEAVKLRNDSRVYCVEIPPEFRTDIKMRHTGIQTGLYYKGPNTGNSPDNNLGINWGVFRSSSRTNNTPDSSGTLTYEYSLDGTGVDIVIQDTGIQIEHPEFQDENGNSRIRIVNWYTENGAPSYVPIPSTFYTDFDGHGTHVAGIAAGKTYGRAKNARIYLMTLAGLAVYPTEGINDTSAFDLIKGWHERKPIDPLTGYKRPTVLNMSWGYTTIFESVLFNVGITGGNYRGTAWTGTTKQPQYGMIGNQNNMFGIRVDSVDVDVQELLDAGVVLVGGAGNYSQKIDTLDGPDYNNYFTDSDGVDNYYMRGASPTATPGVILVGSVDSDSHSGILEQKASYSETGPRIDVYAPGTNIISSTSNTNTMEGTASYPYDTNYKISSISGTSMASPNIVGVVAQLLQLHPNYTPAQIRALLIADSTPDALYSTGLLTDYSDLRSLQGGANKFVYQHSQSSTTTTTTTAAPTTTTTTAAPTTTTTTTAAPTPIIVYFKVTDGVGLNDFVIKLTDPVKIQSARDQLNNIVPKLHITGLIIKSTVDYNPNYSYHYDPDTIDFFEVAMEVCDATFDYTEEYLDEAGGAFLPGLRLCPWMSELLEEVSLTPSPTPAPTTTTTTTAAPTTTTTTAAPTTTTTAAPTTTTTAAPTTTTTAAPTTTTTTAAPTTTTTAAPTTTTTTAAPTTTPAPTTYSYIKDNTNTWQRATAVWIKHQDGTWKQATSGWKKNDDGTWDKTY